MRNLSGFKSVICLNGNLPGKVFFRIILENNIPIIGADGGANLLYNIGVNPDFIVGDMDSCRDLSKFPKSKIIIIEDQNYTDFEKAIKFLQNKGIENSLVLGINGGEIDHVLNNVNTFIRYAKEFDMWFYDVPSRGESKLGSIVKNDIELTVPKETTISIFSFDDGKLTTEGMVWDIDSEAFSILDKSGARNRARLEKVSISTTGKSLLTIFDHKFRF